MIHYKKIPQRKVMKRLWSQNGNFGSDMVLICGSLQTILLCSFGELAGGRSIGLAVGVSDMGQDCFLLIISYFSFKNHFFPNVMTHLIQNV